MVVVGVTGEKGSGKDTFCTLVEKQLRKYKIEKVRFSDLLGETLDAWHLSRTRHNLQRLAIVMDEEYGTGTLCEATKQRVLKTEADIVLLMGIRWLQDVEMLRSFEKNIFVYVTADPNVRWERTRKRREKTDEHSAPFEQFIEEEGAKTEVDIGKIGRGADCIVENDGSLDDFCEKATDIVHQIKERGIL